MNKYIIIITFTSIGFIVGILLNKYVNKKLVNKIYNYSDLINLKLIFSINFCLTLVAALYNIDIDIVDLDFNMVDKTDTVESFNSTSNT